MKRLKQILQFNNLSGHLHFILVAIILTFIFINSYHFLIFGVLILFLIYIFFHNRFLWGMTMIILISLVGYYYSKIYYYHQAPININGLVKIIEVNYQENYQKILLKYHNYQYIYYHKNDDLDIKVGDQYYLIGSLEKTESEHTPNGFNYQKYLQYENVVGTVNVETFEYHDTKIARNPLNQLVNNYYQKHFSSEVGNFIKALVIGNKNNLNSDLKKGIQTIGISHLFVVSGLHVGIIVNILDKSLKILRQSEKRKTIITISFLFLYLFITNFLVSVIRVTLGFILKKLKINDLTNLDLFAINFIIVVFINPFYLFSYSFILTYLISGMIIVISPFLFKRKGLIFYFLNMMIISVSSVIITLPVVVSLSPEVNFLSIFYNLLYIPLVSYFILPLAILLSFLPFFAAIGSFLIKGFSLSISFLEKFDFLTIAFPTISPLFIIMYYLVIIITIFFLERKKYYVLIILPLFVVCWQNIIFTNCYDQITFLDLKEGEATLIEKAFNQGNILIDTGIGEDQELEDYLNKRGIKRLDLIIISHGDADHNGCLERLIDQFKVEMVILNAYDHNSLTLLETINYQNYYLLKSGDSFNYQDLTFEVLWPYRDMFDSNNNSLVFIMTFKETTFLFTGDIESRVEKEIIQQEKSLKVDVLKIAHHGSLTSTSPIWLEKVDFRIGVAMNGYRNTFGFPHQTIRERLRNYQVYYTIDHHSVIMRKRFNQKEFKIIFKKQ